ncbi:phosphotransferase KptA/Tpt1 [Scheffersomyces coipomensis]|uniref:phosphotransferase KptA/Tpt1 n=1 Tax=Scheffersomyces coipomensis TaxID=1788519 RepID=UPI00315D0DC5
MSAPDSSRRDTIISKGLAYLLRHGAIKENLTIDEKGYVKIPDLLNHTRLKSSKTTMEDILRIVANDTKQRYTINDDGDMICANQGHSIKAVDNTNLILYTKETIPKDIYHGTFKKNLGDIIQSGGLSRMGRNHIHFTSSESSYVAGKRYNSNILIYINVEKCLLHGIQFYKSLNGAILSEGDGNGFIKYELFDKVIDVKLGVEIDISTYKERATDNDNDND